MKLPRLLLVASLLLVSSIAGATVVRPVDVLGEATANLSPAAVQRWDRAISAVIPGAKLPTQEQILGALAKLVGAKSLAGLDLGKPVRIVLLDPKTHPSPAVLVGQAKAAQLKASLLDSPAVAMKARGALVALGESAAIERVAEYALAPVKAVPSQDLTATAYLTTIWAAYGEQAKGMKTFLVGTAQGQGSSPAMLGGVFDAFISGVEQSERLVVELSATANVPQLTLSLVPRSGTAIARFATAQKPSDFSLLARLAAQPMGYVMAGRVDLRAAGIELLSGFLGADPKAFTREELDELLRLWSGELAMVGQASALDDMSYAYLLGTSDGKRLVDLLPRYLDAFSSSGIMGGLVKIKRQSLPPFEAEGVSVAQSEVSYDYSALPSFPGKKQFSLSHAWAAWDTVAAVTMGGAAKPRMLALLGSTRRGEGTLVLSAAQRASLDRARAAKDFIWMWLDPASFPQQAGKPLPLPPNLVVQVGMGVAGTTTKLKLAMLAR